MEAVVLGLVVAAAVYVVVNAAFVGLCWLRVRGNTEVPDESGSQLRSTEAPSAS
ncbi:MAG: hypothetical protein JOZ19_00005 [Rubrobacter sp.]|nr:hypothetical protein [Rubrobacter sp.]